MEVFIDRVFEALLEPKPWQGVLVAVLLSYIYGIWVGSLFWRNKAPKLGKEKTRSSRGAPEFQSAKGILLGRGHSEIELQEQSQFSHH